MKKYVGVFAIGGKIFVDYGDGTSPAQFERYLHFRVEHPVTYPKYRNLPTTKFMSPEIRDITDCSKEAVVELVQEMKRKVGQQPIR